MKQRLARVIGRSEKLRDREIEIPLYHLANTIIFVQDGNSFSLLVRSDYDIYQSLFNQVVNIVLSNGPRSIYQSYTKRTSIL